MKRRTITRILATMLLIIMASVSLFGCTRQMPGTDRKLTGELIYATVDEYLELTEFRFPETDSDYYYRVYDDCAIISKCLSDKAELTIPALYRGVPVVGIYDNAFEGVETLRKITLGANQLWIGYKAFAKCTNLTTVIMSGTVNRIDDSAFSDCESLRSIIIPSGIQEIPANAFANCRNLKKVVIEPYTEEQMNAYRTEEGAVTKTVGSGAFSYCNNLSAIWLPSDVAVIADNSFAGEVRPVVYGAERSEAALFAADNLLSFVMTTRNGFDAAARLYKPLVLGYSGSGVEQTIVCGDFSVTLDEVNYYEKLGNAAAGEHQTLIALSFNITNNTDVSRYFEGLNVSCKSLCKDENGETTEYVKYPILISSDILGIGYPAGPVIGGTTMQGVIVLRMNERFEAAVIRFPGAQSDFVIDGGR